MIEWTAPIRDLIQSLPNQWGPDIIRSLVLVISLVIANTLAGRALMRQTQLSLETRRRWAVNLRNVLLIIGLLLFVIIWFREIETVAVSLVAIAAAIAISGKEMIMCFVGSAYRTMAKCYSVGDHIEINNLRGRVIDFNLFGTTLMEIGPGRHAHQLTGRLFTIPNSLLFTHTVFREDFSEEYTVHVVSVPLAVEANLLQAEAILMAAATDICEPFMEKAQKFMAKMEAMHMVDSPSVKPRASIQIVDEKHALVMVRIGIPPSQKQKVEQAILHRFVAEFFQQQARSST